MLLNLSETGDAGGMEIADCGHGGEVHRESSQGDIRWGISGSLNNGFWL